MDNINRIDTDEPPSNKANLGVGSRLVSALNFVDGRHQSIRALWAGDWDICPTRSPIFGGRHAVFTHLQKGIK